MNGSQPEEVLPESLDQIPALGRRIPARRSSSMIRGSKPSKEGRLTKPRPASVQPVVRWGLAQDRSAHLLAAYKLIEKCLWSSVRRLCMRVKCPGMHGAQHVTADDRLMSFCHACCNFKSFVEELLVRCRHQLCTKTELQVIRPMSVGLICLA